MYLNKKTEDSRRVLAGKLGDHTLVTATSPQGESGSFRSRQVARNWTLAPSIKSKMDGLGLFITQW